MDDPKAWINFQEKVTFFTPFLTPIFVWFAGKFLYNKWEKRRLEADTQQHENKTELTEIEIKHKEAELLLVYENMIRRASDDSVTKSDRWRKMELEWTDRFDKLESRMQEQKNEIAQLRSENICLNLEIKTLQVSKDALQIENAKLKDRVQILEQELKDRNGGK